MPVLDASALTADPEGLAFLRDVLGTTLSGEAPGHRFPVEAWTPKFAASSIDSALTPSSAPALDTIEPRFADAAL